jgi:hypothetical protein
MDITRGSFTVIQRDIGTRSAVLTRNRNDHESSTPHTTTEWVGDRERKTRCNGRIDCVSSAAKHLNTCVRGNDMISGDGASNNPIGHCDLGAQSTDQTTCHSCR